VLAGGTPLDQLDPTDDSHWHATAQFKFERLLQESKVPIGLLVNGQQIRLVYKPASESSGYLTFNVAEMAQVAGRPILAALQLLLGDERLFSLDRKQRLPSLLADSRKYQNVVSTELAKQVLEALYELVRGFQAANDQVHGELLRDVLAKDPNHVYAGLLTVLMRLVFVLFAEDRGLLSNDPVYANFYSVIGLFNRLRADHGRYPDTMDQRYGAWAQLLTLFRLIYEGGSHGNLKIPARRGYLFDPARYPFLGSCQLSVVGCRLGEGHPDSAGNRDDSLRQLTTDNRQLNTDNSSPTPDQILSLKVCDPAMGSGAFLVEACRQLADELVKAWHRHRCVPPLPPDEDEVLHARRLVAQRCLYGVDKNPMAVDLAKLSLWLATLAKDHPFTFLDHSLKSGDSLVGLTKRQIVKFTWESSDETPTRRVARSQKKPSRGRSTCSPTQSNGPCAARRVCGNGFSMRGTVWLTSISSSSWTMPTSSSRGLGWSGTSPLRHFSRHQKRRLARHGLMNCPSN
jgi:hypothetical protein